MPDERQWKDDRFYGQSGMRGPWRPCPPCPPCPPCGGRPPQGPGRPPQGPGRPPQGPGRPPQGPGRPPQRPCRPWDPFCDGWRGASAESVDISEQPEMGQMPEEDMYMTDEPEKEQMEQDWLYMKQLYPNAARKLQRYIDDAADRLEYEDSMMFDEYPDEVAVEQLVREIIAAIQENEPDILDIEKTAEEMMPGSGENGGALRLPKDDEESGKNMTDTWSKCVEVLIRVMLLGEMHHRRWRYFQMKRRNY